MAFKKTGDATIAKIFCKCGAELKTPAQKCPKCGKELISKDLKESPNES